MIETGGKAAVKGQKAIEQGAAKLRFNVTDSDGALAHLVALDIETQPERYDWARRLISSTPKATVSGFEMILALKNNVNTDLIKTKFIVINFFKFCKCLKLFIFLYV